MPTSAPSITSEICCVTFQPETVDDWAKDAAPLYRRHWLELGLDLDLEISPDLAKLRMLESAGIWKTVTARSDGNLVGYALAVFSKHLHYSTSDPMYIIDAYYVLPEYRSGNGVKLLKFTEYYAKSLGAIKIYLSCKVHEDHSALFLALGYRLSDYAFIKRI